MFAYIYRNIRVHVLGKDRNLKGCVGGWIGILNIYIYLCLAVLLYVGFGLVGGRIDWEIRSGRE